VASATAASVDAQQPDEVVSRTVTQPVYYKVKRGDTLRSIAQKNGVSMKNLLAWNHLKASSRVKPGRRLRVGSRDVVVQASANPSREGATSAQGDAQRVASRADRPANNVVLAWPASGAVVRPFEAGKTRGIEIGGKSGDPVCAAAAGKVVYAGTGLNGYGSLIIVQHSKDFLTAYAYNRKLLVKTGDVVEQGQQIAEMGSDDDANVTVMFELRRDGKPVDPMPYLPGRG
jgi:lipoprotein NlpD